MSVRVLSLVWDNSASDGGRLLTLLALADYADDDGRCWPSIAKLAKKARLSERQVKRILGELAADGEIVMPPGPRSENNPFTVTPVTPGHHVTGTPATPKGGQTEHVEGDPTRPREEPSEEPSKEPPSPVREIWDFYLATIPSRRALDAKRERIIRNALKLRSVEEIKRAIVGLSLSPHHQQRRDWQDIRYALRGIGDESDDDRIEKAMSWAAAYAPNRPQGLDPDKALRYLEEIREYIGRQSRDPNAITGRERAIDAYKKLIAAGYEVEKLDRAPWARFSS